MGLDQKGFGRASWTLSSSVCAEHTSPSLLRTSGLLAHMGTVSAQKMLQTGTPALETGAHSAFILSLFHSAGPFIAWTCRVSAHFSHTLSHEVPVGCLQLIVDIEMDIWPTPGYISKTDNPNENIPLFTPEKYNFIGLFQETYSPQTYSCSHQHDLLFRHLLWAELCHTLPI